TFAAEGNHVLGQDAGAGTGAADGDAGRIRLPDQLGGAGAAQDGGKAQLIPAGEEDATGAGKPLQPVLAVAIGARGEVQRGDASRAQFAEDALIAAAGVFHAAGGGNHHDVGVLASAQTHESL